MYLQVMSFSYSEHSAKKLLTLCGCDPKAGSGVLRSFCPQRELIEINRKNDMIFKRETNYNYLSQFFGSFESGHN